MAPFALLHAALASVVLAPTGAVADEEQQAIEEVIVTAAKREQGVYEVPASLSVFNGDGLAKRGIADLVDIGKRVPNLVVTTFAAGHTSSANPFIRGIGTQDHLITADPGVGVYVDGVYLGRQVGQHWNLSNIERVEVLRGPQGTLYGRNSIGGAVNIVTAPPGSDPGTRVAARVGSRGRLNAAFHGDANLTGAVAATLSGSVRRRSGVGAFLNLPDADTEVGETHEVAARLALAWQPSAMFSLTLAADANDGDNGLNPYTTLIDEVPAGAVYAAGYRNADVAADPYDNNTGQADQVRTSNAARGIAVTAEWMLGANLTARTIASLRRSEYEAGLDDDGFYDDYLSFPERGEADQSSVEAQVLADFDGWDLVAGVYRFGEDGANVQDRTVFLGFEGTFRLDQKVDSTAVFANVGRELSERWRVGGGLRWTRDRKRAGTDVGTGPVAAERSWSEASWDLSVRYDARDRLAVYAAAQSGYQSGQFPARPYCLFADPNCFAASDNVTALNYEIGVKGQPWRGFELSAAAFHTRYDDLPYQVSTTAGEGFNTVNLIVEQRTNGLELENTFRPSPRFLAHVAFGYVDIEVERRSSVYPVAPLTPKFTLSVSPEYRWPLAGGGEFAARLDYSYRGAMWGEPSSDPGRLTRIDSRALVNSHVAFHSADGAWTVALYGLNVTDARYDQARLNTGDYILRILSNDAREFGLRVRRRF